MEQVPAEFLNDPIDGLSEILVELNSPEIRAAGTDAFSPSQKTLRTLHTIKGSAQTFGLADAAGILHEVESLLGKPNTRIILDAIHQLVSAFKVLRDGGAAPDLAIVTTELKKLRPES